MRFALGGLVGLLFTDFSEPAHAQDEPAALRAELARQGAALERLERREAERTRAQAAKPTPTSSIVVSGYAQVDWVVHNQASHNEIN